MCEKVHETEEFMCSWKQADLAEVLSRQRHARFRWRNSTDRQRSRAVCQAGNKL